MAEQIVDLMEANMPGPMGDVTPEAVDARDRAERAAADAEKYAAGTKELQDGAVAALIGDSSSSTSVALEASRSYGVHHVLLLGDSWTQLGLEEGTGRSRVHQSLLDDMPGVAVHNYGRSGSSFQASMSDDRSLIVKLEQAARELDVDQIDEIVLIAGINNIAWTTASQAYDSAGTYFRRACELFPRARKHYLAQMPWNRQGNSGEATFSAASRWTWRESYRQLAMQAGWDAPDWPDWWTYAMASIAAGGQASNPWWTGNGTGSDDALVHPTNTAMTWFGHLVSAMIAGQSPSCGPVRCLAGQEGNALILNGLISGQFDVSRLRYTLEPGGYGHWQGEIDFTTYGTLPDDEATLFHAHYLCSPWPFTRHADGTHSNAYTQFPIGLLDDDGMESWRTIWLTGQPNTADASQNGWSIAFQPGTFARGKSHHMHIDWRFPLFR